MSLELALTQNTAALNQLSGLFAQILENAHLAKQSQIVDAVVGAVRDTISPVEKTAAPAEKPVEKPAAPAEKPAETVPAEKPVEKPAEAPRRGRPSNAERAARATQEPPAAKEPEPKKEPAPAPEKEPEPEPEPTETMSETEFVAKVRAFQSKASADARDKAVAYIKGEFGIKKVIEAQPEDYAKIAWMLERAERGEPFSADLYDEAQQGGDELADL